MGIPAVSFIHCRHIISVIFFLRKENSHKRNKILSLHWSADDYLEEFFHHREKVFNQYRFYPEGGPLHSIPWGLLGRNNWLFNWYNEQTCKECNQIKFPKTSNLFSAIISKSEQRLNNETVVCFGRVPQVLFIMKVEDCIKSSEVYMKNNYSFKSGLKNFNCSICVFFAWLNIY